MCEDGSDPGTGGGQAAQGKCVEREESYTRTLANSSPQSGGGASRGQLRGRKRTRSQGAGGGEARCGLQGGVSQARPDAVERQEGLDGDVLVDDGAAVEPVSLVL